MDHSSTASNSPVIQFVQAGKHRVCYAMGGNDTSTSSLKIKPRVLLLHGWISSHQLYRSCWAGLEKMTHYCAVDLVGFGDSDKPSPKDVSYDPRWFGEQLKAFVDAMGWNKVILIAHSMGVPYGHKTSRVLCETPPQCYSNLCDRRTLVFERAPHGQ